MNSFTFEYLSGGPPVPGTVRCDVCIKLSLRRLCLPLSNPPPPPALPSALLLPPPPPPPPPPPRLLLFPPAPLRSGLRRLSRSRSLSLSWAPLLPPLSGLRLFFRAGEALRSRSRLSDMSKYVQAPLRVTFQDGTATVLDPLVSLTHLFIGTEGAQRSLHMVSRILAGERARYA